MVEVPFMKQVVPSSWMRQDRVPMMGGAFDARILKKKAPFMGVVIALLIVQLLLTFFVMERLYKNTKFQDFLEKNKVYMVLAFLLPFVIILILAFVPMPMYMKLLLFSLFSIAFGILLSMVRRYATPELIRAAVVATLGIFVSMFVVGIVLSGLGYDLFWLGMILFVVLLILVIAGVIMLFTNPDQKVVRARAIIVIILFAIYVL